MQQMATLASPVDANSFIHANGKATSSTSIFTRVQPMPANHKRRSPLSLSAPHNYTSVKLEREPQLDSSDDESAAPALSAAAEELLGRKAVERSVPAEREHYVLRSSSDTASGSPASRSDARAWRLDAIVSASPSFARSEGPRIVRISRHSPGQVQELKRNISSSTANGSPLPMKPRADLKTPAPRPKTTFRTLEDSSNRLISTGKNTSEGSLRLPNSSTRNNRSRLASTIEAEQQIDVANMVDNRAKGDENGPHGSVRVKKLGKVQGRFLSGPARRGMMRRQSEEEQSPTRGADINAEKKPSSLLPEKESVDGSPVPREEDFPTSATSRIHAAEPDHAGVAANGAHEVQARVARQSAMAVMKDGRKSAFHNHKLSTEESPIHPGPSRPTHAAIFKAPPQPCLHSSRDQENEPLSHLNGNVAVFGDALQRQSLTKPTRGINPIMSLSPRRALAPKSQNTPQRAAPPPPKMTMLETATATAGAASTSQRRLKRQYISVNGKMFTKMECIGRGGSGRVYKVMAENLKLFALKRVSLEEVDQTAIRGFKGEIDLLKKLEHVDRVIRIYDFEINDEKKTLSVLMDLGELDLKKILDPRLDEETGSFDITFTRHIWKEMLECVEAIHAYDIVHSDLKPANFVYAHGRLKLIDFGIANAIQDDTVNVHREQQIGTPNYMAPEALLDTNALGGRKPNIGKLMKLGKPSDVWSLACILYQIVYGKPPFGHIPNQMNKVIAITDISHAISFPELGVGKIPVPSGLVRTLRRCLSRDPSLRPMISELLSDRDPFLHPDGPGFIQISTDHLKAIQHNVLRIIEAHGLPEPDGNSKEEAVKQWLDRWSPQLFVGMKASIERAAA